MVQPLANVGLWPQLLQLMTRWQNTPQAQGAINATKGFNFQFWLVLHQLATLVREQSADSSGLLPPISTEILSDILNISQGRLVITQVKYCIDSHSLSAALTELWQIYQLISTDFTDLAEQVQFKVAASRAKLKDIDAAIARWQPKPDLDVGFDVNDDDNKAEHQARLTAFKARLSRELAPDPLIMLAHDLIDHFNDPQPFITIDKWLGQLYASVENHSSEHACQQILVALKGLFYASQPHRINLWRSEYQPPGTVSRQTDPNKAVLVGQVAKPFDLTEGRFAPRSCYQQFYDQFDQWQVTARQPNRDLLPVFWLAGRSGCGKSVALLHLLATIKQQDPHCTIVWFGNRVGNLADLNQRLKPFSRHHSRIILAFDDPYASDNQRQFAEQIDNLQQQIESDSYLAEMPPPLIVCCGPTEQFDWFSRDLSRYINPLRVDFIDSNQTDIDELATWYHHRTGRIVDEGQKSPQQLMVQTLFHWHNQTTLVEFARSFAARLQHPNWQLQPANAAYDLVSQILAVNRLYGHYPSQAYQQACENDPNLGETMTSLLAQDHHFSLTDDNGIRFTHPHLANVLYQHWFGDIKHGLARKRHLKQWLDHALQYGQDIGEQLKPLWIIANASSQHKQNLAADRIELILLELQQLLPQIYQNYQQQPILAQLPVWTDLNANLALNLQPNPVELLASTLAQQANDEPGYRLACRKLIKHQHSDNSTLQQPLLNAINQDCRWSGWLTVTIDYLKHFDCDGIQTGIDSYIQTYSHTEASARLIAQLLKTTGASQAIASQLIQQWLVNSPVSHPAWPTMFTRIFAMYELTLTDPLRNQANRFMRNHQSHNRWPYVWLALWQAAESQGSNQKTDQRLHNRAALRDLALTWLNTVSNEHGSWAHVWLALWQATESQGSNQNTDQPLYNQAALSALALTWLNIVSDEHGSWAHVWQALWQVAESQDSNQKTDQPLHNQTALSALALTWLNTVSAEHGSWKYVWLALWQATESQGSNQNTDQPLYNQAALSALALTWLDAVSNEHGSWAHVWQALWQVAESQDSNQKTDQPLHNRAALRDLALTWLNTVSKTHGSWAHVWLALWQAPESQGPNQNTDQPLYNRAALRDLALTWLDAVSAEHGSWKYVWEALWQAAESVGSNQKTDQPLYNQAALSALALTWLNTVSNEHGSWYYVWLALWQAPESQGSNQNTDQPLHNQAALSALALTWLNTVSNEHGSWYYVWLALWQVAESQGSNQNTDQPLHNQAALRALALTWLNTVSKTHGSWSHVWEALWQAAESKGPNQNADQPLHNRAALSDLALTWLNTVSAEHGSWAHVWLALWQAPESQGSNQNTDQPLHNRAALRALALTWLNTVSNEHGSWYYVWQALWQAAESQGPNQNTDQPLHNRAALRALALTWLNTVRKKHGSWAHVWLALWQVAESQGSNQNTDQPLHNRALRDLALTWLDAVSAEHVGWAHVWEALWQAAESQGSNQNTDQPLHNQAALRDLALTWLDAVSNEHGSWAHVWLALWQAAIAEPSVKLLLNSEHFAEQGISWLTQVKITHPSWTYVWKGLWQYAKLSTHHRHQLVLLASDWLLKFRRKQPVWQMIWQKLWTFVSAERGQSQALEWQTLWLKQAGLDHYYWSWVWQQLFNAHIAPLAPAKANTLNPAQQTLIELGLQWLAETPQPQWENVWVPLWQCQLLAKPQLRHIATDLLQRLPPRKPALVSDCIQQ